jgi:hypothetical protein
MAILVVADDCRDDANRRGNAFSRISVSRLAPLPARRLGRYWNDRSAMGHHSYSIRSVRDWSGVRVRGAIRMVSSCNRLDHSDYIAARLGQCEAMLETVLALHT